MLAPMVSGRSGRSRGSPAFTQTGSWAFAALKVVVIIISTVIISVFLYFIII